MSPVCALLCFACGLLAAVIGPGATAQAAPSADPVRRGEYLAIAGDCTAWRPSM